MPATPSVFLIGCVNGGTSIVAKLYQTLGWRYSEDNEHHRKFMECSAANAVTVRMRDEMDHRPSRPPTVAEATERFLAWFRDCEKPVICKDHRFSFCLSRLSSALIKIEPTTALAWVQKDLASVARSIRRRRGNKGWWWNRTPEEWFAAAEREYQLWPGQKWIVPFGAIKTAVATGAKRRFLTCLGVELFVPPSLECVSAAMALFDTGRDNPGNPNQGKDGWQT